MTLSSMRPKKALRSPAAHHRGVLVPARTLKLRGDIIDVDFADADVRVSLRMEARKRYFRIEIVDAQPADIEWLTIDFPLKKLATQSGAFAANYGDAFSTCGFALDLQGRTRLSVAGPDNVSVGFAANTQHGIKGARFALLACPREEFNGLIQEVERKKIVSDLSMPVITRDRFHVENWLDPTPDYSIDPKNAVVLEEIKYKSFTYLEEDV